MDDVEKVRAAAGHVASFGLASAMFRRRSTQEAVAVLETLPEVAPGRDEVHGRLAGSSGMAVSSGMMRRQTATARLGVLAIILVASGCSSGAIRSSDSADGNLLVTDFPGLPDDARRVAERLASCTHFAGEINGDKSERDTEVFAAMTALGCDTIDGDASAIRQKYVRNPLVRDALDAASQW